MKNLDPPDDFDESILESFEEIERRGSNHADGLDVSSGGDREHRELQESAFSESPLLIGTKNTFSPMTRRKMSPTPAGGKAITPPLSTPRALPSPELAQTLTDHNEDPAEDFFANQKGRSQTQRRTYDGRR